MEDRDKSKVQAVERALEILIALSKADDDGLHITEIAAECGLKLSTCHRLLGTMSSKGFVYKDSETGAYCLGNAAKSLSRSVVQPEPDVDLKNLMAPMMMDLSLRTGETINLSCLDGGDVFYMAQIESRIDPIPMFAKEGSKGPAYCTGSGKALLAWLPQDELDRIISGYNLVKMTSETIDDPHKLRLELQRIKSEGYSLDLGERDEGIRCIAAPVFSRDGLPKCAISVAGPKDKLTNFYLNHELIRMVCETASRASKKLQNRGI